MASRHTTSSWGDYPRQYAVPAYNPSDYYDPQATANNLHSRPGPYSDSASIVGRRPAEQDLSFAISAVSPGLPVRPISGRNSAASILLDRFFSRQSHSPLPLPQPTRTVVPQSYLHGAAGAPLPSPGFPYASPPVTPGFPPNAQTSFQSQSQYMPPPPLGPPPSQTRISRNHSVVEITVPPSKYQQEPQAVSTEAAVSAFRQPARGQAPRPLRDRELAAAFPKVPSYPVPKHARFDSPPALAMKSPPLGKRSKPAPAPIDVQLAEGRASNRRDQPAKSAPIQQQYQHEMPSEIQRARDEAAARLQGLQRLPQTAGLPTLCKTRASPISPTRGVPLAALNTQLTKAQPKSAVVEITLSPSMSPPVVYHKSPISFGRNSNSATPPMWSPETPRAMSFDFPMIISATPPTQGLEWADPRRETIIEEDMQEQTPMELGPPRSHMDMPSPKHVRARSLSPPGSAYPKESPFSWDLADLENRHATDEDFYDVNRDLSEFQMMEDQTYLPQNRGFNPRQTILGSYFKC